MTPTTIPGFYIDERIGLTVAPGCAWNDKTGSRWRVGVVEAPPPKSRLLASIPNVVHRSLRQALLASIGADDNTKSETTATDWAKGGAL